MIKDTNERIAITLSKDEIEQLNYYAEYFGMSKTAIIKLALMSEFEQLQKRQENLQKALISTRRNK